MGPPYARGGPVALARAADGPHPAGKQVDDVDSVHLWLGANVMLEYERGEAIELLNSQVTDAKKALATTIDDMGFLRDQITTTEVNMARVFNWDVKNRRQKSTKEATDEPDIEP